MSKIVLDNIASGYNLSKINDNFTKIAVDLNTKVLYRAPPAGEDNTLQANIDANSQRIYNLPDPITNTDAVPKKWAEDQFGSGAVAATASAAAAALSEANAANSAASASASAALADADAVSSDLARIAAQAAAAQIVGWEYKGNWTTTTTYALNNIVTGTGAYAGWSLICIVAHTSSGVDTDADFGLGYWGVLSQRGAAGPGSGDMLSTNNLSDVASADLSLSNLGGTVVGKGVFRAIDAPAARLAIGAVIGTDVEAYDATILKGANIGVTVQGYDVDTAKIDVAQLWTAHQRPKYLDTDTVSTSSTYTYDASIKGQINLITLTNAITVTFGAPGNIVAGTMYKFILKAGDTNARSFAWNSAYKFPAATPKLTTGTITSGAYDVITFIGGATNTLIYDGHGVDVR